MLEHNKYKAQEEKLQDVIFGPTLYECGEILEAEKRDYFKQKEKYMLRLSSKK